VDIYSTKCDEWIYRYPVLLILWSAIGNIILLSNFWNDIFHLLLMNVYSDLCSISLVYFMDFCFQGRLTLCMLAHDEVINKTSDTFGRKLFIRSLSRQVTSGMLHDYFAGHGYIEECSVVYYDNTDISW
jgi:hypothetical protein